MTEAAHKRLWRPISLRGLGDTGGRLLPLCGALWACLVPMVSDLLGGAFAGRGVPFSLPKKIGGVI